MAARTKKAVEFVKVKKAGKPKTEAVPAAKWVQVSIKLTAEQKAQLAKMGVHTSKLKIRTFNIERLRGPGPVEN